MDYAAPIMNISNYKINYKHKIRNKFKTNLPHNLVVIFPPNKGNGYITIYNGYIFLLDQFIAVFQTVKLGQSVSVMTEIPRSQGCGLKCLESMDTCV